jgi:hypothetical protein
MKNDVGEKDLLRVILCAANPWKNRDIEMEHRELELPETGLDFSLSELVRNFATSEAVFRQPLYYVSKFPVCLFLPVHFESPATWIDRWRERM